jgi:hypothetical protein
MIQESDELVAGQATLERGRMPRGLTHARGCLRECAGDDCKNLVFGSGFCIECERATATGAPAVLLVRSDH